MGAVSCPAVCRFGACGGHVPTLCLRCTRSFLGVAWRSSSVAFLLVPLPPSAFFLIYLFSYLFFQGLVLLVCVFTCYVKFAKSTARDRILLLPTLLSICENHFCCPVTVSTSSAGFFLQIRGSPCLNSRR